MQTSHAHAPPHTTHISRSIPVSRLSFTPEEGNDNVQALAKGLSLRLPGGWSTVQSLHLKTVHSVALPIHKMLPKPPPAISVGGYSRKIERKRSRLEEPGIASTAETKSPTNTPPPQRKRIKEVSVTNTKHRGIASGITVARIRGSRVRKAISVSTAT